MKKYLWIFKYLFSYLFVLSCLTSLSSQEWLQDGQVWNYDVFGGFDPSSHGINTLEVVGDTIISDIDCKVLAYGKPGYYSHNFAYVKDEAVYAYSVYLNGFLKIYDFSLQSLDTISLLFGKKYRIDSVGVMDIKGEEVRFQHFSYYGGNPSNGFSHGPYLILEGIGLVGKASEAAIINCAYFFLQYDYCSSALDGLDYHFQCFNDDAFKYDPDNLCSATSTLSQDERFISIYPNPSSDYIVLEADPNIQLMSVELINLNGKSKLYQVLDDNKVDISQLPPQTYIVKVADRQGRFYYSKIIVIK